MQVAVEWCIDHLRLTPNDNLTLLTVMPYDPVDGELPSDTPAQKSYKTMWLEHKHEHETLLNRANAHIEAVRRPSVRVKRPPCPVGSASGHTPR